MASRLLLHKIIAKRGGIAASRVNIFAAACVGTSSSKAIRCAGNSRTIRQARPVILSCAKIAMADVKRTLQKY